MNLFQIFVLFSIFLVIICIIFFTFKFRKHINHSYSMMIAMTFGTNIGLTVGVLFGTMYQKNLYISTLTAMIIGVLAGSMCGFAFGIIGFLEGFMAGFMGSMMGAMLGAMITASQSDIMVKILLTLTICSMLLFLIIPQHPKNEVVIKSKIWFLKPIITIILIVAYLIIGTDLSKNPGQYSPIQHHTLHIKMMSLYSPNATMFV